MIALICDACQTRFEVGDDVAGATVKCPKCGARNGVPAPEVPVVTTTATSSSSSDSSTPSGDQVLLTAHPAMFRARPARFTLFFLLLIGGIGGAGYFLL